MHHPIAAFASKVAGRKAYESCGRTRSERFWQIKDFPQPQPGPGQVLVKTHTSGICYTDVHETRGTFQDNFSESSATAGRVRLSP
jgi:D-arabinose 1-dehydrogenase-like Zn-dependent alcohol dehydrogenase